ncbi:DUF2269 family protein [Bacillus sp. DTU_2020_1000418_1_SI_GHA_SEK_038]|uniref:DUF2269 family protein n=1 Tax=Bacillus sp. DTU_2020_1000418_1_SI_GHA_SEK_038 TaxID=3077585 RepID=UPI0028E53C07|nr:DUF2269 family protein [Bacillus sp. DTU_2020_1000418_1_SI_GHA_SEK_038]WNS75740.1 DUF2269 family protein [Bacillus sp. DTU_2020_1000418_1_SI_GHA_SEK_038]
MKWLVLIHVLSAIIGVGPTYFGHIFLRKKQSIGELKQSLMLSKKLEYFPKIGGTIAVLTGIALVVLSSLSFTELWILASILLYIGVQIVVVGFIAPVTKQLSAWLQDPTLPDHEPLPEPQSAYLGKANRLYYVASGLGTLLFILMILKPVF